MLSQQFKFEQMLDQPPDIEIPDQVKHLYKEIGESMQFQINRKRIRNFSSDRLDSWVRSKFRLNEDERVVQKHKLIASQISNYLFKSNQGYKIPLNDVRNILQLEQQLAEERRQKEEEFRRLKQEVEQLRKRKRKIKGSVKAKKTTLKPANPVQPQPVVKTPSKNQVIEEPQGIDYDFIYGHWMKHVETKSTSKSYWYIHEYIGRYILNFAIKNNAKSINSEIVQQFLDDYGEGKAAKTMNHYNRVAKYFLEFCLELSK